MASDLMMTVQIVAGTSEENAAAELARLAERVRITVEAKHNGVTMIARPYQLARDVLAEFKRDQQLARYPSS